MARVFAEQGATRTMSAHRRSCRSPRWLALGNVVAEPNNCGATSMCSIGSPIFANPCVEQSVRSWHLRRDATRRCSPPTPPYPSRLLPSPRVPSPAHPCRRNEEMVWSQRPARRRGRAAGGVSSGILSESRSRRTLRSSRTMRGALILATLPLVANRTCRVR